MAASVHVRLAGHHDNPVRFHQQVDATLTRQPDGALEIIYSIHGLNLDLRMPTPHAPAPVDALWKTSCFEIFLGSVGQPGYREFNFSPSGQWATHEFSATRQHAPQAFDCPPPRIELERGEDLLKLTATLPKQALPKAETLRIAVAVILEANDSRLGYWALVHPPGQPDFHHHAGFVLSLGALGFRPAQWP